MRRILLWTAASISLATSAHAAEELKISSGISSMSNIFSKVVPAFEKSSGVKVVFTNKDPKGHGGDQSFKDVDTGVAEAGSSGTTWEDWVKLMKDKGYTPQNLGEMRNRVIGRDRIQFMTYKGGVKKLSEEQIIDLLSGKITNWKDVGGEDKPVVLLLSGKQPSTAKFLQERLLKGKPLSQPQMKTFDKEDITEVVKEIGKTPGGFGFGPINAVSSDINSPEQPTVGRPILMLWRGTPSKNLQAFMSFIEKEGPKLGVAQ